MKTINIKQLSDNLNQAAEKEIQAIKEPLMAKIQEAERQAWDAYQNAKELAESNRFGTLANELEKQARTRWATLYELMEDIRIEA